MFTATIMMLRSIALASLIRAVTTEHAKNLGLIIKDSNFFRIITCHSVKLEGADGQVSSLEKLHRLFLRLALATISKLVTLPSANK